MNFVFKKADIKPYHVVKNIWIWDMKWSREHENKYGLVHSKTDLLLCTVQDRLTISNREKIAAGDQASIIKLSWKW